jgi:hypothetical protein
MARQREENSKRKRCPGCGEITFYCHGGFPKAGDFTGLVDRKLQERSFANLSRR